MDIQLNNLINNTKITIYINNKDTVIDIKKLIASSFPKENKITESNLCLYYKDPQTNGINYMLSPFRTILSHKGILNTKEIFVEKNGIQLDSALAIIIENLLPILTFYNLYKKDFYYTKMTIHKVIFFLTCLYFICRLFLCLKTYNNGQYFLSKLIINLIIYWFLYSIICGYSIFSDDLDDMSIYSYLFTLVFIICQLLCLKLFKEYKAQEIKNILFNYVKYPYYTMDCLIWISMMIIIFNKRIIFFTIIKILYNIYLAFEQYIEERGKINMSSNLEYYNYYNNNNAWKNNGQSTNNKIKVIIPFFL